MPIPAPPAFVDWGAGGSVLIWWRRGCRTALRRRNGAATNLKSGHYQAGHLLDRKPNRSYVVPLNQAKRKRYPNTMISSAANGTQQERAAAYRLAGAVNAGPRRPSSSSCSTPPCPPRLDDFAASPRAGSGAASLSASVETLAVTCRQEVGAFRGSISASF